MTLTFEISPELERGLTHQAEQSGVAVPTLAALLLEQAVTRSARAEHKPKARSQAEIRAWLDSVAEFSDQIRFPAGETFSREMIYQDRD